MYHVKKRKFFTWVYFRLIVDRVGCFLLSIFPLRRVKVIILCASTRYREIFPRDVKSKECHAEREYKKMRVWDGDCHTLFCDASLVL